MLHYLNGPHIWPTDQGIDDLPSCFMTKGLQKGMYQEANNVEVLVPPGPRFFGGSGDVLRSGVQRPKKDANEIAWVYYYSTACDLGTDCFFP